MKRALRLLIIMVLTLSLTLGMIPVESFAAKKATTWTAFMMYSSAEPKKMWEVYKALPEGENTCTLKGDGTYTITLKASDIGATEQAVTPQVFVIDIPEFAKAMQKKGKKINNYTDTGAKHDIAKHYKKTDLSVSVKVYVDGNKIDCNSKKINYGDVEEKGTFRIELYNIWGLHNHCITEDPPVDPADICPTSEIKVTFTIKGSGYNTAKK